MSETYSTSLIAPIAFVSSGLSWDIYSKNLSDGTITNLTNQGGGMLMMNDFPDWNPARK